jgi:FkbM family methyltransferase
MTSTLTLTLNHEAQIVVPNSLDLITPYVLLEQQDWFEDEIKFLRRLLQPGQQIIDIGANYGVYTLSMAKTVGGTGQLWSFEPASNTASFLRKGIAANGFTHIVLEQSALSSVGGTAELSLNQNSELNSLVHNQSATIETETVPLVTLDECIDRYGWQKIDFIKIDAEGEETNILKGGERFFTELSPLVQYEIKAGEELQLELVQAFTKLGYSSYRLVPGLDLLVPFNLQSSPDRYLLNLFCCKPDQAKQLADRGYLLLDQLSAGAETLAKLSKRIKMRDRYDWCHTVAKLPYGLELKSDWELTVSRESCPGGNGEENSAALAFYALSQDQQLTAGDRFTALQASFNLLKNLCDQEPTHLRLASLARVATDLGLREIAVNTLSQLAQTTLQQKHVDTSEPFLAPGRSFDLVPPGADVATWCLAAILDELERVSSFSSFYTGVDAQPRLEFVCSLGINSDDMERRLSLLYQRFNLDNN